MMQPRLCLQLLKQVTSKKLAADVLKAACWPPFLLAGATPFNAVGKILVMEIFV
jgi:hypothetical protein